MSDLYSSEGPTRGSRAMSEGSLLDGLAGLASRLFTPSKDQSQNAMLPPSPMHLSVIPKFARQLQHSETLTSSFEISGADIKETPTSISKDSHKPTGVNPNPDPDPDPNTPGRDTLMRLAHILSRCATPIEMKGQLTSGSDATTVSSNTSVTTTESAVHVGAKEEGNVLTHSEPILATQTVSSSISADNEDVSDGNTTAKDKVDMPLSNLSHVLSPTMVGMDLEDSGDIEEKNGYAGRAPSGRAMTLTATPTRVLSCKKKQASGSGAGAGPQQLVNFDESSNYDPPSLDSLMVVTGDSDDDGGESPLKGLGLLESPRYMKEFKCEQPANSSPKSFNEATPSLSHLS